MKIFVKTLKGAHFEIEVKSQDTVADVKKNIEKVQGSDVYPAAQQILIYQGKVLKDETNLEDNKVAEKSFVVIMLTKNKASSSVPSTKTDAPSTSIQPPINMQPPTQPVTAAQAPATAIVSPQAVSVPPTLAPAPTRPAPAPPAPAPTRPAPAPPAPASSVTDVYGQAASNHVAGSNIDTTVQHILDMGCGSWDRDTVLRALRAAYNNPERAIDYLYSGIPEQADVRPAAQPSPASEQTMNPSMRATQPAALPSGGPNANPLDLFPQGLPNLGSNASGGTLDFLRSSQQFQTLRAMVRANPQILQPMLQELGKQNPHLVRLIQDHQADFLRLINEPAEGDGNILEQLGEAMPQAVAVTLEERAAIERLEAMGFDRDLVLEVYFACNKNEELAANYLLDHVHEFDE